jgi:hypothetical protein
MKILEILESREMNKSAIVIKAPDKIPSGKKTLFLCGSINQGDASNWAEEITEALSDLNIVILNPRRDNWDSKLKQDISNPVFVEQVTWELDAQDNASAIAVHFDRDGKSPITLLEIGLYAASGRISAVHCPEGFWRRGNVEILCKRYNIPFVDSIDELVEKTREMLG